MFTIGDFARHGRVSVRMLRHYDALGLLRPAHVDPATGYRHYTADQLARLNRLVALKDLGFTLQQVGAVLDEQVSAEELRGMLVLRRAELRAQVAADTARLARVEARLRTVEGEVPPVDVVLKVVPAVRLVTLTDVAAGYEPESIGPVVGPLCGELARRVAAAGARFTGPAVCYYQDHPSGDGRLLVHAGVPVTPLPDPSHGLTAVDLPEITAATAVHRGSMAEVVPTGQALARWIEAHGYRSAGYAREQYLATPDDETGWVTELQEPVAAG